MHATVATRIVHYLQYKSNLKNNNLLMKTRLNLCMILSVKRKLGDTKVIPMDFYTRYESMRSLDISFFIGRMIKVIHSLNG